jgi:hypothetical protein
MHACTRCRATKVVGLWDARGESECHYGYIVRAFCVSMVHCIVGSFCFFLVCSFPSHVSPILLVLTVLYLFLSLSSLYLCFFSISSLCNLLNLFATSPPT